MSAKIRRNKKTSVLNGSFATINTYITFHIIHNRNEQNVRAYLKLGIHGEHVGVISCSVMNQDKIRNRNRNNRKPKIDEDVKELMRKNFTQEYDFYHFCKQRLYKQYISIKLKEIDPDWK